MAVDDHINRLTFWRPEGSNPVIKPGLFMSGQPGRILAALGFPWLIAISAVDAHDLSRRVSMNATNFQSVFPYLNSPTPGTPVPDRIFVELRSSVTLAGPFEKVAAVRAEGDTVVAPRPADGVRYFKVASDIQLRIGDFTAAPSNAPNPEVRVQLRRE